MYNKMSLDGVKFVSPMSLDATKTQFAEIFKEKHYGNGLKRGKDLVIVDIGSNIGLSVMFFKDIAKKIYALEPNNVYYKALLKNTKGLKNVETFNFGIAPRNGKFMMRNEGAGEAETLFGSGEKTQEANFMTLKNFLDLYKIDHVDILKIDCEGAEYAIFMSEDFEKVASRIDYIIGESHFVGDMIPHFVLVVLQSMGFKVNFLPFNNLFRTASLDEAGHKGKEYKLYMQTIFEADRI
jgi:FkbM family methyltransferase